MNTKDPTPYVFGIGLPRSAGQSLQKAICLLTRKPVLHALSKRWDKLTPEYAGAVEVYAPVDWLLRKFPNARFVYNDRALQPWLASCRKVYGRSSRWGNPIWRYPMSQFEDYRYGYMHGRWQKIPSDRLLVHDFTASPTWEPLLDFLGVSAVSCAFPNRDLIFGRD